MFKLNKVSFILHERTRILCKHKLIHWRRRGGEEGKNSAKKLLNYLFSTAKENTHKLRTHLEIKTRPTFFFLHLLLNTN
jgi:hypothetical protein